MSGVTFEPSVTPWKLVWWLYGYEPVDEGLRVPRKGVDARDERRADARTGDDAQPTGLGTENAARAFAETHFLTVFNRICLTVQSTLASSSG